MTKKPATLHACLVEEFGTFFAEACPACSRFPAVAQWAKECLQTNWGSESDPAEFTFSVWMEIDSDEATRQARLLFDTMSDEDWSWFVYELGQHTERYVKMLHKAGGDVKALCMQDWDVKLLRGEDDD